MTTLGATSSATVIPTGEQDPGSISLSTSQTWEQYVRLGVSATERLTIAGAGRIILYNAAEPDRAGNVDYDPVVSGNPVASRISFVVPDGWQLPILERLIVQGSVRATVKLTGRIIIDDYAPRTRMVLQGSSAGR